ncbi:MAG TPA: M28 family peptidase [Verrucomicrobiae bacterium]|nr:M28 family peptidase [Verrucomicrobiae bacterium]
MCKSLKHYPPPIKSKKMYVKPVPYPIEKSKKIDDEIESILKMVSTDTIKSWVLKLSSYHTRHSKSKYIHDIADWLRGEFVSMGYDDVDFHTYTENIDGNNYNLQNVYCNKNGIKDKCILICAHYDSRMKILDDSESRAPGANDNASGVSAILEIARIVKNHRLEYPLQFVLFSGEEQGLLGSKHYAKFVKDNNVNIYRLINLDMIAYPAFNPGKIIIELDNNNKPEHNQVKENDQDSIEFGKEMADMSVYTDLQINLGSIYDSDYEPFEAEGFVVIGAYDGSAQEDQNPHYHDSSDTPDLIDWNYLTSVTKMVLATILKIAKGNP